MPPRAHPGPLFRRRAGYYTSGFTEIIRLRLMISLRYVVQLSISFHFPGKPGQAVYIIEVSRISINLEMICQDPHVAFQYPLKQYFQSIRFEVRFINGIQGNGVRFRLILEGNYSFTCVLPLIEKGLQLIGLQPF
jgi:hypothetical protein